MSTGADVLVQDLTGRWNIHPEVEKPAQVERIAFDLSDGDEDVAETNGRRARGAMSTLESLRSTVANLKPEQAPTAAPKPVVVREKVSTTVAPRVRQKVVKRPQRVFD